MGLLGPSNAEAKAGTLLFAFKEMPALPTLLPGWGGSFPELLLHGEDQLHGGGVSGSGNNRARSSAGD